MARHGYAQVLGAPDAAAPRDRASETAGKAAVTDMVKQLVRLMR
jgi:hypothetical protein